MIRRSRPSSPSRPVRTTEPRSRRFVAHLVFADEIDQGQLPARVDRRRKRGRACAPAAGDPQRLDPRPPPRHRPPLRSPAIVGERPSSADRSSTRRETRSESSFILRGTCTLQERSREVAPDLADDRRHRVGRELDPALELEAVDRLDQPDRADLDEVVDRLAAAPRSAARASARAASALRRAGRVPARSPVRTVLPRGGRCGLGDLPRSSSLLTATDSLELEPLGIRLDGPPATPSTSASTTRRKRRTPRFGAAFERPHPEQQPVGPARRPPDRAWSHPRSHGPTVATASASSSMRSTGRSRREPRPPSTSAPTPAPRRPAGAVKRIVSVIEPVSPQRAGCRATEVTRAGPPAARHDHGCVYYRTPCRNRRLTLSTEHGRGRSRVIHVCRRPRPRRRCGAFDAELEQSLAAEHLVIELAELHVHRLLRAARAGPGPAARHATEAASSRSSLRRSPPGECSRSRRSTGSSRCSARSVRPSPHLPEARSTGERGVDARVELHHVVEQCQLEDPPHVRVVDDDPQLGAVRPRTASSR